MSHKIIITPGEPAGCGPEIVLMTLTRKWPIDIVVCASPELLLYRANLLGLNIKLKDYTSNKSEINVSDSNNIIKIIPIKNIHTVKAGYLNKKNSDYVIHSLEVACDLCMLGEFDALVTGPVHKAIINDAGIPFTGHTEFLSDRTKTESSVMMMVSGNKNVVFATTHVPLRDVSKIITTKYLKKVIVTIHNSFKKIMKSSPEIYVCGINPHAGECGYIGNEESKVLIPVIKSLALQKIRIKGPFSADTILKYKSYKKTDVILSMYHDQLLPVLKYCDFDDTVNVTLGLPFVRTSVCHGTAVNSTITGNISANNLKNVINYTFALIK